jgi:hypothetical protein
VSYPAAPQIYSDYESAGAKTFAPDLLRMCPDSLRFAVSRGKPGFYLPWLKSKQPRAV